MPATTMTRRGPKHSAATRLPLPSMFTSWPSSLMALLLMRNVSQVSALRMSSCRSAGVAAVSRSMTGWPRRRSSSFRFISSAVMAPPQETTSSGAISSSTFCAPSIAVGQ